MDSVISSYNNSQLQLTKYKGNQAMLKSELISVLNDKLPGIPAKDVELALDCILELMIDALSQGKRIEIRDFGSFELRNQLPRIARNPKTGESINLPAKTYVHFKPGKGMRERVDAMREQCDILE